MNTERFIDFRFCILETGNLSSSKDWVVHSMAVYRWSKVIYSSCECHRLQLFLGGRSDNERALSYFKQLYTRISVARPDVCLKLADTRFWRRFCAGARCSPDQSLDIFGANSSNGVGKWKPFHVIVLLWNSSIIDEVHNVHGKWIIITKRRTKLA